MSRIQRRPNNLSLNLGKVSRLLDIEEDPHGEQEELPPVSRTTPLNRLTPLASDRQVLSTKEFLLQLQKYSQIYELFTSEGFSRRVISKRRTMPRDYFNSYIVTPKTVRTAKPSYRSAQDTVSFTQEEVEVPVSAPHSNSRKSSQIKEFPKDPPPKTKRKFGQPSFVDNKTPSVKAVFNKILRGSAEKQASATLELLKVFLQKRYCSEMVDEFCKIFQMNQFLGLDQYANDLSRVVGSDEKMLKLCFELFDFNKDRYLCYDDMFVLISHRTDNFFDSDLLHMKMQMKRKKRGQIIPVKIKKQKQNPGLQQDEDRPRIPHVHPSKPEAITYEDFTQINFPNGKPQIFQDFIYYMTGLEVVKRPDSAPKNRPRKASEEAAQEIKNNPDAEAEERYKYYLKLQQWIERFPPKYISVLMDKFNLLRCPSYKTIHVISKDSVHANWHKVFGVKNKYLEESFYNLLAGPSFLDVTKAQFLEKIHILFEDLPRHERNYFAFLIFDKRKDGLIRCEEINEFVSELNQKSAIAKEVSLLANEYLESIYGKKSKELKGIDFKHFKQLIPYSVITDDFYNALLTPIDKLPYRSKAFQLE